MVTAVVVLTREQTQTQVLNQLLILVLAEAIQKEDGDGPLVGVVTERQFGRPLPHEVGGLA